MTYSSPVEPRLAAHGRGVGARAGLGERVGGKPLAGSELGQVALLLLVRPGQLETERAQLLDGDDQAARRTDLGDLLDRHERHQGGGAEAAVLLVVEDAEDPVLAEELDDVPGELGRLVDLGRARRDALARELADQLADLLLLLGQRLGRHARNPRASLLVSAPWRSWLPSLSPFSASSGRPWRSRTAATATTAGS